jgi:hypothetical protein
MVTAYLPDDSGAWAPSVMPKACPTSDGAAVCRIGLDHLRARKTGPCVPVVVLTCSTHGCRFTLYPSGHVPYGREAVAPVGLDGKPLTTATPDVASAVEEPCSEWRQTRFAAMLDAAQGKAWSRDAGPCWTTQLRRLDESAALLGLDPAPCAALGEKLAYLLDLPRLSLIDDASRLARAVGFQERGGILVATLERASKGRCILERVLACGALAGLWSTAHLWRATPGGARCTVFPGRGTPSG